MENENIDNELFLLERTKQRYAARKTKNHLIKEIYDEACKCPTPCPKKYVEGQAPCPYRMSSRQHSCGFYIGGGKINVKVLESNKVVLGDSGEIIRCGNIKLCPACAPILRRERSDIIRSFVSFNNNTLHGSTYLLTLTLPHDKNDELKDLYLALAEGWRRVVRTQEYKDLGLNRYIKTLEETHGVHGWHPHLHILYFMDEKIDDYEKIFITDTLKRLWREAFLPTRKDSLGRERKRKLIHHSPPSYAKGADFASTQEIGNYLTKFDEKISYKTSQEVSSFGTKSSSLTPYEMLLNPTTQNRRLFKEYALASYRKRYHTFSKGFFKVFLKQIMIYEIKTSPKEYVHYRLKLKPKNLETKLLCEEKVELEFNLPAQPIISAYHTNQLHHFYNPKNYKNNKYLKLYNL